MLVRTAKSVVSLLALLGILVTCASADALVLQKSDYEDALDKINHIRGVQTCQSISATAHETFLLFNPSNLRTFYFRSECYQRVAVETRDETLCDQVIERKSILFDGSGISPAACRQAVSEIKSKDFSERVTPESIHRIQHVDIAAAPSGDIELRVFPQGTLWGTYQFSVSLLDSSGTDLGKLFEIETHLSDRKDPLFTSLQRRKIQTLIAQKNGCGKSFTLRIGLKLIRDDRGQLQRSHLSEPQLQSTATEKLSPKDTGCR